jgi:hypothetical protein
MPRTVSTARPITTASSRAIPIHSNSPTSRSYWMCGRVTWSDCCPRVRIGSSTPRSGSTRCCPTPTHICSTPRSRRPRPSSPTCTRAAAAAPAVGMVFTRMRGCIGCMRERVRAGGGSQVAVRPSCPMMCPTKVISMKFTACWCLPIVLCEFIGVSVD